jgi:hypothetical protein
MPRSRKAQTPLQVQVRYQPDQSRMVQALLVVLMQTDKSLTGGQKPDCPSRDAGIESMNSGLNGTNVRHVSQ